MENSTARSSLTMSRRGFLGIAGIAGAAVAGGSLLSGCTPSAPSESYGATGSSSTSGDAERVDPIAAVEPPDLWSEEADVVVCGSGGGLVAAVRSAELGNKVIVVEKADTWGGSSKETDIFSVMGTETQKAIMTSLGEQLAASGQAEAGVKLSAMGALPAEQMRQQWIATYATQPGNGDVGELPDGTEGVRVISGNVDLITAVANGIANSVDWMASESVGIPWGPVTEFGSAGLAAGLCPQGAEEGGFVARANYSVFETLYEKAVELGVKFLFKTPLSALVKEGAAVVGVKATGSDGDVYIKARKGVILATGGMAQNKAMLNKYVPSVGQRALNSTASMMDTGEGILMAWGAGADMQGFDASFCFDGGIDCGTWNHYLYKGDVQLARQPWLGINVRGERCPYYPVDTLGFTRQCGIWMSQPRNRGYVIFDANYEDTVWNWEQGSAHQFICRRPMWPEGAGEKHWDTKGNYDRLPESVCEHDWREGVRQGIEGGYIFECDSLDELAEKIGMQPAMLTSAVEEWNAACEAGVDERFHLDPAWLVPIKDAPYYGMAVGATVLATNCGVAITPEGQAVGTDGAPIQGLYAAGSCVGGIGGDSTYGDCRNPGGGVALTCGTAFMAANAIG